MEKNKLIDKNILKKLIEESDNIVFFGGAGVSTASNIPDFRSPTGLYNEKSEFNYPPEYLLSHSFFVENPKAFTKYYKTKLIYKDAKPNACHLALTKLEKMGKLKAIITQNIDSLHQKAGSKNVIEIHGNLRDYYCISCGKTYSEDEILKTDDLNICECGGIIRPDIVLYEEGLDMNKFSKAINYISNCDLFIVGGTSLAVYPAAGLLRYYNGNKLVILNMEKTPMDELADYIYYGDISKIMEDII